MQGKLPALDPLRRAVGRYVLLRLLQMLASAIVFAAVPMAGRADEAVQPTVFVVDSSGSMAAREADGRVRLDAARQTIVEALGDWPADTELGMIAYGHRRVGDCADIETIVPLGPLSTATVASRLADLRARGKTPLSGSLIEAAALLPASGGDIVLVSDGLETCGADPCAVADSLRRARANVAIHVVGFAVTKDEQEQLRCIAEDGGGQYFEAMDARALSAALGEVAAVIATAPMAQEPVTEPVAPPTPKPVSLVATAGGLGEIVDAPVSWVVTAGSGEVVYQGESRALMLSLLPGSYQVVASAANASGRAEIDVPEDDANGDYEVAVVAGRLDLSLAANAAAAPYGDQQAQGIAWTLEPLDGQRPADIPPIAGPSLLLAPGTYRVVARLQDMVAEGVAEVAPGAPSALKLNFQIGTLVLEAALSDEHAPLADDRAFAWRIGDGGTATAIEGQSRPRLTLPAGRYPIELTIGGLQMTAEANVVAGEERVERLLVKTGELALSARLGPGAALLDGWRDTTWHVYAVSALGVEPGASGTEGALLEAMPRLTLLPGSWRVVLESGVATVEREVVVRPEAVTELVVDIGAARLTMNATPSAGEPPTNIVYRVFAVDAEGSVAEYPVFSAGSPDIASLIVPAGRWRIAAFDEFDRSAEADADLGAGDEIELRLSLE